MYDDVLLPVALGEADSPAVERAIDLAARTDATLHVLSVVDPAVYDPMTPDVGEVHDALEGSAATTIEEVESRAESADVAGGVPDVLARVGHGSPHTVITEYVGSKDIDVVVMATHGREGLKHALLGSVTEKVVRTVDVPVLTVPTE